MEPWQLGVVDVVTAIASGELSAVELLDSCVERIEAFDLTVKAWATLDLENARRRAEQVDAAVAAKQVIGELEGLPLGVKDVFYTAGLRTAASSKVLADFVPGEDAASVAALRRAGAIIVGKAHTTEFANGDPAVTRNPWNVEHTPGGSSSGSAAAVAAGMVPAALGTQTGGSTLRPAAYNGIVGLKPTYGLISNHNVIPLAWSFDHVGILARSVADAELLLRTLAGYDRRDPASSERRSDAYRPVAFGDLRTPPRIGIARSFFLETCDPEVLENVERVARKFEAAGAEVREIQLPPVFPAIRASYATLASAETAAYHEQQFANHGLLYQPKIAARIRQGLAVRAVDYVRARRDREVIVADLERGLEAVDVLLTPSTPTPPPRDLSSTGDPAYITPWSYTGLPTISVPSGLSHYQLPLGIQLVGHRWHDAGLLEAAHWCESILEFRLHPPCWAESPIRR